VSAAIHSIRLLGRMEWMVAEQSEPMDSPPGRPKNIKSLFGAYFFENQHFKNLSGDRRAWSRENIAIYPAFFCPAF